MQTRVLGNSDMDITRIGLGAWAIGGGWSWGWGQQRDDDSVKTIHKALEMGVNWIDTAAIYGLGHSEEVVSKALKSTSYRPYIFTKCGLVWDEKGNVSNDLSRASVEKEVDDSLRRLDVDVIDLYQIHWPNPDAQIEEAWETMVGIREKGKIRYLGVSNFSVDQVKKVQSIAPVTSHQPPYSMIFPKVEDEILPYCHEQSIGVINYSPMASGLLSGKMTRERFENLDPDDWRHKSDDFKEPKLTRNLALADLLKKIGDHYGCTAGEVAIAWTLLNPAITGAIVGMRHPDQVNGVIHAGEIQLSDDDVESIQDYILSHPV